MVMTDRDRTQVMFRRHDAIDQDGLRVFDDHGHGEQLSIDILSRSFALDDWQYCKSPVETATHTALFSTPLVEAGRDTTANSATTQSTTTSKSLQSMTSPEASSHSTLTTTMSSATNMNHETAATAQMGSTKGTSTPNIHAVSEILSATQTPVVISTESSKLTNNVTQGSSSSQTTSTASMLLGLPQNSVGIVWCPQNLTSPCNKGQLCILISNISFCL